MSSPCGFSVIAIRLRQKNSLKKICFSGKYGVYLYMTGALVSADVLEAGQGLSVAMLGTLTVVGMALWCCGWRWHRFWMMLGMGLLVGGVCWRWLTPLVAAPPLVFTAMAALCGAWLGVELVRLGVFVAGGVIAMGGVQHLVPGAHELWLAFVIGGLVALLLFRWWVMLLTAAAGTWLMLHAGLLLTQSLLAVEVIPWIREQSLGWSLAAGVLSLIGLAVQIGLDRWERRQTEATEPAELTHVSLIVPVAESRPASWWQRLWGIRQTVASPRGVAVTPPGS